MSSLSDTKSSDGGGGTGCRWLRFEYENCLCQQRAILKIVVDPIKESNGMLYFVCEKKGKIGGSKYFRWCHPKCVDFEGCNYLVEHGRREDKVGRQDGVDSELSPNRVEGGSKVKDCILVLFVGFSL